MVESESSLELARERTDLARERNGLANERTFLSWLRTGLGGMGGGVAIIRLLSFQDPIHRVIAHWIGYFFILWGVVIFLLALVDYKKRRDRLGLSVGFAGSTAFVSLLIGSLVAASLVLLFIVL